MPYKDKQKRIEYQAARSRQRRIEAIKLLGSKCVRCQSSESLEIDHINPDTKTLNWAKMYGASEQRFLAELAKCQLLCKTCHIEKSIKEQGFQPRRHGRESMYRHGCRCDLCRAACHETWKKANARKT